MLKKEKDEKPGTKFVPLSLEELLAKKKAEEEALSKVTHHLMVGSQQGNPSHTCRLSAR